MSRPRSIALLALAVAWALWLGVGATTAAAHPLGNFTVNHLSQVRISSDRVEVHYILDQAEIPTFQEAQRFDRDGNGSIEGPERGPLLRQKLSEFGPALELVVDGRPQALSPPIDASLSFPPGQGGLLLTRIEADFEAPLARMPRMVTLHDGSYEGRVGWRAVQVLAGEGTDVRSSVPATDPTNGLRAYPQDLLSSPPEVRDASFAVTAGAGRIDAPRGPAAGPLTTDRAQDGFAGALAGGNSEGLLVLLLLGAAFGWGALHAFAPGHGKAMVASYLVGSRGTSRDAAVLGLTVTVTHTFVVFAFGFLTLFASQYVLPEDLYPWLGVASGVMVIVIGLAVMRSRFRRWRALRREAAAAAVRAHHAHHAHSHAPPEGPITTRGLLALGVSGGIVPCPSALVVLIAAISQHRLGLGMALILAFSLGLAATLMAVGFAVIHGGRLLRRLRPERRLFGGRFVGALPAVSATLIVLAGTLITLRAIPAVG